MIPQFRYPSGEQRKLLLSICTNVATRIPGAVGVLWFLPLLRLGLGVGSYAILLASIALGTAATFLCSGFSLIGRRLIGEAYAVEDHSGEADAFASVVVANSAGLSIALAIIIAYCWMQGASCAVLVISVIPAVGIFLTTFDNVRSAYNEHYVTASLQLVLQTIVYTVGFLLPVTQRNIILAAMVLQLHYVLASLVTLALLLRSRPYLLNGAPTAVLRIAREGIMVALADGFLITTLSLSVVWLQSSASTTTSAWFATTVRLFQTLLVPVILLLVPFSSYARILWSGKSLAQKKTFAKATLWIGVSYGAIVSVASFIASHFYVVGLLHLAAPGGLRETLPIFLLFGVIVAWKGYSSIAYLVFEDTSHLSFWTTAAIGLAVTAGVVASLVVDPLSVIDLYALVAGATIMVVMCWNVARFLGLSSCGIQ